MNVYMRHIAVAGMFTFRVFYPAISTLLRSQPRSCSAWLVDQEDGDGSHGVLEEVPQNGLIP
jgi:hypothetical protein